MGTYLHISHWVALHLLVAIVDDYISTSYAVLTGYICMKMSGSESRGQEEATCMCSIRPMQPLQRIIYADVSSNFLKYCGLATITGIAYFITDPPLLTE